MATYGATIRRGLPRWPGGDPWPSAGEAHVSDGSAESAGEREGAASAIVGTGAGSRTGVRRGLPRTPGGEPWPPADFARAPVTESLGTAATDAPAAATPTADEIAVEGDGWPESDSVVPVEAYVVDVSTPIPFTRTAWAGIAASWHPTALAQPAPAVPLAERIRATPWTRKLSALIGALALLIVALAGVFLVRAVLSTDAMSDWLARYPGEYHLPESSSPGFPAWVQWQHFFNMFFMVLIIRTGLQVRAEKRPPVYWTPKWSKNGNGKISLALWLHQSLDILWLVNGILFVVLLFATNHWMRIVPTSWDVFPNALSALLQYVSLAWPTENGWVNYNSLQQIMYFLTVFVAAPLAAVTGVRMSGLWPKNAIKLSRAYPVEWARAVHFPVMVYFVVFIIIHVALVFATGVLRNLNHMYGGTDAVNWPGFLIFTGSMVLVIAGWIGARPLVLTPIAALTGKVSGR